MNLSAYHFDFKTGSSIVQFVDEIIGRAEVCRASDIHIDPRSDDIRIRFRIDGVLQDVCIMPKAFHSEFLARIKILSGLRIDERVVPQDGRMTFGQTLDIRVTVVASYYGESIVMRLLNRTAKVKTLGELGFTTLDQEIIDNALQAEQGLILVTGPTGSGKTTTLYSLLSLINDTSVSTVTIEDPVEYAMAHARQIQVQQKRGVNFANGLRSILRQDPDVIMVGEIRDKETATIATGAALTGHLVLSTLHTNDAISTIARCIEMGVEPYLVAATLRLVVSQRLVRRLCNKCKHAVRISLSERLLIEKLIGGFNKLSEQVFEAKGCESCNNTGYLGRIVVAEILPITTKFGEMIAEGVPIEKLRAGVFLGGTIRHRAVDKYLQGVTSFKEIIKILHD